MRGCPFLTLAQPKWKLEADRVVQNQRRVPAIAPAILASVRFQKKSFTLEEAQPTSDKIDLLKTGPSTQGLHCTVWWKRSGRSSLGATFGAAGTSGCGCQNQRLARFGENDPCATPVFVNAFGLGTAPSA